VSGAKPTSAALRARRPVAEKAIETAAADIEMAKAAKQAALESGDRKALGAARDDFDEAEFAHSKAVKALATLDSEVALAEKDEKRVARREALLARDEAVVAAKVCEREEADAFLQIAAARVRRAACMRDAGRAQDIAVSLASDLGDSESLLIPLSGTSEGLVACLLKETLGSLADADQRRVVLEFMHKLDPSGLYTR